MRRRLPPKGRDGMPVWTGRRRGIAPSRAAMCLALRIGRLSRIVAETVSMPG